MRRLQRGIWWLSDRGNAGHCCTRPGNSATTAAFARWALTRSLPNRAYRKMTLYSYFGSKDGLIVACLDSVDERYRLWLERRVAEGSITPADQILGIFDALKEWFEKPTFRGCVFVNATVELADPEHPARRPILNHKHRMREWIADLAAEAGLSEPAVVGAHVMLLMEGAIITALVDEDPSAADRRRKSPGSWWPPTPARSPSAPERPTLRAGSAAGS